MINGGFADERLLTRLSGTLSYTLSGGENSLDLVRAWRPVTSRGAPSPRSARTCSAPRVEQGLGAPVTGQGARRAGEEAPLTAFTYSYRELVCGLSPMASGMLLPSEIGRAHV